MPGLGYGNYGSGGSRGSDIGGYGSGGSYGVGGSGSVSGAYEGSGLGPGGIAGKGIMAFDDGGVTGDGNDDSTIDPMQMIMQSLQAGRQQMGVPQTFYPDTNQEQQAAPSFDDGGQVPDQQDQGQNPGPVNPKSTIQYLTGAGAVRPEIADAMAAHIDPQGQMDPAERNMAMLTAAPNDEARFGLMQHMRTRFNMYSGGAQAALQKGDMGTAAMQATQAMANVPTGQKVQFAPARGGLAMLRTPIKGRQQAQPQQGFAGGGLTSGEDTDNPSRLLQAGYDDGGETDDTPDQPTEDQQPTQMAMNQQFGGQQFGGQTYGGGTYGGKTFGGWQNAGNEPVAVSPKTAEITGQPDSLTAEQVANFFKGGWDKLVETFANRDEPMQELTQGLQAQLPATGLSQFGGPLPPSMGTAGSGMLFGAGEAGPPNAQPSLGPQQALPTPTTGTQFPGFVAPQIKNLFPGGGEAQAAAVQANPPSGAGPDISDPTGGSQSPTGGAQLSTDYTDPTGGLQSPAAPQPGPPTPSARGVGAPPAGGAGAPPPPAGGFAGQWQPQRRGAAAPAGLQSAGQQPQDPNSLGAKIAEINQAADALQLPGLQRRQFVQDAMAKLLQSRNVIQQNQALGLNRMNLAQFNQGEQTARAQMAQNAALARAQLASGTKLNTAAIAANARMVDTQNAQAGALFRKVMDEAATGGDLTKVPAALMGLAQQLKIDPAPMQQAFGNLMQGAQPQQQQGQQPAQQQGQQQGNIKPVTMYLQGETWTMDPKTGRYKKAQ
jgi:hypothetical protein